MFTPVPRVHIRVLPVFTPAPRPTFPAHGRTQGGLCSGPLLPTRDEE